MMSIKGIRPVTKYVSSEQAGLPVNSILISYRRKTAGIIAANLRFILKKVFGEHVPFRDIESIPPGDEFRQKIIETIDGCRVFLLLIDPSWHTDQGRQRLENKNDYVRFEIEKALEKGPFLRIIPVLVNGAAPLTTNNLPKHLQSIVKLQSIQLGEGEFFESSVERIIDRIQAPV
jgi:hypothetical protein